MKYKRKILFLTFLFFLFSIGFTLCIYYINFKPHPEITDVNLIQRQIETPTKFLLNGYLGHFFRLKYLGNINWMILPFLAYFFYTIKQRKHWEIAFVTIYLLALLLIGVKGYFNSRYQMTLFPVTVTLILYLIWNLVDEARRDFLKKYIFVGLVTLVLFNDIAAFLLSRIEQAKKEDPQNVVVSQVIFSTIQKVPGKAEEYFATEIGYYNAIKNYSHQMYLLLSRVFNFSNEMFNERSVEKKKRKIEAPYMALEYLNDLKTSQNILVNNIPLVYYYTNKKGVYYWCGDDIYYTSKGRRKLMDGKPDSLVTSFLLDSINCKYIFSVKEYNDYNAGFKSYLKNNCVEIYRDSSLYMVYEVPRDFSEKLIIQHNVRLYRDSVIAYNDSIKNIKLNAEKVLKQ